MSAKTAKTSKTEKKRVELSLGTAHFRESNQKVREALAAADMVEIRDAFAQRYLGSGMPAGKRLEIHGVPGNDLACFMDGGQIEVFGNAQEQVANTMNDGLVVIHGRCGDAAGYGMRGGKVFIRDGCGWRVGINMKQYQDACPTIVIGGDTGAFLAEYMAGGIIVLLGAPGAHLASGMHGGVIYLRTPLDGAEVPTGLEQQPLSEGDKAALLPLLEEYNRYFAVDGKTVATDGEGFVALRPASARPYSSLYAQ